MNLYKGKLRDCTCIDLDNSIVKNGFFHHNFSLLSLIMFNHVIYIKVICCQIYDLSEKFIILNRDIILVTTTGTGFKHLTIPLHGIENIISKLKLNTT